LRAVCEALSFDCWRNIAITLKTPSMSEIAC
jgi:hypothetical protein